MRMLIVGLLKNDDDNEMREMADAFEKKYKKDGHTVTRSDHQSALANTSGNGIDVLVLCGHCRCYVDIKCTDVAQRKLGGFDMDDATKWILKMVAGGVKEVWIWCCEAGLSERNKKWTWGKAGGESLQRFTGRWYDIFTRESGMRASVVDYVACAIWKQEVVDKPKKEDRIAKELFVKGFYNVGYIGQDGDIQTFEQSVLSSANTIRKLKKLEKNGKKFDAKELAREERKLETNVNNKRAPDIVAWRLVLGKDDA